MFISTFYFDCKCSLNNKSKINGLIISVTCHNGHVKNQRLTGHVYSFMNVFTNLVMKCEGKVSAWQFYARKAGPLYICNIGGEKKDASQT